MTFICDWPVPYPLPVSKCRLEEEFAFRPGFELASFPFFPEATAGTYWST